MLRDPPTDTHRAQSPYSALTRKGTEVDGASALHMVVGHTATAYPYFPRISYICAGLWMQDGMGWDGDGDADG